MNFPQIAQQVIDKLGGKENIATAAHCATRLRIVLNDESKVDKEGIDNIEGVKGQFAVAGQYQIIFGSGTVNKVHAELTKLLGIGDDWFRFSECLYRIATFGERLSGYFRANHSGNRRRRFVNGYSLHAYSERFLR